VIIAEKYAESAKIGTINIKKYNLYSLVFILLEKNVNVSNINYYNNAIKRLVFTFRYVL